MPDRARAGLLARLCLTAGVLLPYWRLLTLSVVFVTDDYFASDVFNGELPGRVLIGQLLRHGQAPIWTSQLCSGLPLTGSPADPIGLAAFTLLPPAPALDLFVVVLLLVAAHGAFSLARRFGADEAGAVLAGVAFAGSGYIACQLKHLAIVSTVVWLPVALLLIDRAMGAGDGPGQPARRGWWLALLGLVFAEQVLCGFPQSAYICALVYGAFALFRAVAGRDPSESWRWPAARLAGAAIAMALGGAAGGVVLLPLSALGAVSDRAEALGWSWSTRLAYWPPNFWTFFVPYIHGDISDNSYSGPPFFWEDYGYLGVLTVLLAIYAAARERRRPVVGFTIAMAAIAYLFVLGQATPVFRLAYLTIPGLTLFRFPTRFLVVVELGLALLGAIGLTRLRADLEGRFAAPSRVPAVVVAAICAATMLDLAIHQPRQNPIVPARAWLAPPAAVAAVHADAMQPRTFTPRHRDLHRRSFQAARGWANVEPYYGLRDVLEPNVGGGFWNTPSADCYAGISARWYVDLWGDHNREQSVVSLMAYLDFRTERLRVHPLFPNLLRTFGVTHVLSPFPQQEQAFTLLGHEGRAYVYRVDGAARARVVRAATAVSDDKAAAARLLAAGFDPDREILLHDAPVAAAHPTPDEAGPPAPGAPAGRVEVVREDTRELVLSAEAPRDGFLLLADTFYPGWSARVDGGETPIYRANLAVRGIRLPAGRHEVRFTYEPPGLARGVRLTVAALTLLLGWAAVAGYAARRAVR